MFPHFCQSWQKFFFLLADKKAGTIMDQNHVFRFSLTKSESGGRQKVDHISNRFSFKMKEERKKLAAYKTEISLILVSL